MAEHAAAADHHHGQMDIDEQQKTFQLFIGMTKWGSLYLAAILVWATVTFCTEAGFMAGLISAVVLLVLGTLVLADKKQAAH